jgi:hypothetical protein
MNKILLTICILISTPTIAWSPDGKFITKEVDRLTIITNSEQESGYQFVSVFIQPSGESVLSLSCSGLCEFYSTNTYIPKIDGFDGMLWSEENAASGDGRWIESTGVVSLNTKDTPTFTIPSYPNKLIGIIQDVAGATGLGSFTLYLIDTDTGAVGEKELEWGENEWDGDVEWTNKDDDATLKDKSNCFLCLW